MFDTLSKTFFHGLSRSRTLKRLASRYGMRRPGSFARRFIAGETIGEAIETARDIQRGGLHITLDQLGESVTNAEEAAVATQTYLTMTDRIVAAGIERNISVKLTQFGLDIGRATCVSHLRRILDAGREHAFFVRIDMENSPYIEPTLAIFESFWDEGYRNAGIVLQSAVMRSEADARRAIALGARVRLVKGAYQEPRAVAYHRKADVDAAFLRMMEALLTDGVYPAFATHDPKMIRATNEFAARHGIAKDRYEFQMLYGIRRDLQKQLSTDGYKLRVYVPFGSQWFPYFMRRLGERPANVGFVLKAILVER